MRGGFLRALGGVAALTWVGLALHLGSEWPRAGFIAAAVVVVAAALLPRVFARIPGVLLAVPRPLFVGACAAIAAGISGWAVHRAMRDQPLSIDAGVYLMQARALAHGHFGLLAPHPVQAFDDRFMLEGPDRRLYGIFPPGWPLALAPFAAVGHVMLAGPAVAIALVLAQAALGRAVGLASGDEASAEIATRLSLLLSLTSIARALETADLLSHALVAALAAFALAGALKLATAGDRPEARGARGRRARCTGAWVGACVGWVLASRLLDGVIVAGAVAGILCFRWRTALPALAWILAGAAPFVTLLLVEQHAATGSWIVPTQSLYFARSDWPPTCHRLGFGADVGCSVEHPGPVARLGGDGYDLSDALRITRERAGALGEDLVGWAPLVLLGFAPLAVFASSVDAVAVAFFLSLTLAYGLFYYGNAQFFDARHLFPAAAFVWLLVARGATLGKRAAVKGVGVVGVLAVAVTGVWAPWPKRVSGAAEFQASRSDLRKSFERGGIASGILKTRDLTSFASSFDPWSASGSGAGLGKGLRIVALDDNAGLVELRRAHPELLVYLSLPGDAVGRLYQGSPPPGASVELDRSWPAFVEPHGLGARQVAQEGASGGSVLLVSHASPGASLAITFDTSLGGTYAVRVDASAGPDEGDYALDLDGDRLDELHGYAPSRSPLRGTPVTRALPAGRHTLVARCLGRDAESTGYDARLDTLVGEPFPANP